MTKLTCGAARVSLLAATLSGCAHLPPLSHSGYCAPPELATFSFDVEPSAAASGASIGERTRASHVARILGLEGVTSARASQSPELRARVVERLALATQAALATSAELDCERARAEQAADYLMREQSRKVQALTVGSVVTAALASIASVLLSTRNRPAGEQDAVAVSGGAISAGLGLSSLFVHERLYFEHPRNLLTDVWAGGAGTAYHPIVWAYLTRPEFSNDGDVAIREKVVQRWRQSRQVSDPTTAAILFGHGGSYDVDGLRERAAMLEQINAEVELVHQDLAAFAASVLR